MMRCAGGGTNGCSDKANRFQSPPGRIRTYDRLLKRELLYRLSYRGLGGYSSVFYVKCEDLYCKTIMETSPEKKELILILDNIRSTYNVGSIFRTAACFGVSEIFLCGVTPAPTDRFGRSNEKMKKVSLHGEDMISWKQFPTTLEAIEYMKQKDFSVVALEQNTKAIDIKTCDVATIHKNVALVLGEETQGLSRDVLDACDLIVEIKTHGEKESLNVSVATGIALFQLR